MFIKSLILHESIQLYKKLYKKAFFFNPQKIHVCYNKGSSWMIVDLGD